jgi:PAS domain S-box-containing protein
MVNPVVESLPKGSIASTEEKLIHVLHVDDNTGYLKTAKKILEMQGSFQVETASSVEEAIEKMEEKTFDVIVSDYIMPGKDGLEFLKELRDSRNNIPFIIFTGKGREIVAIKALNLGANQYINKIGKPEAVYSELAHAIRTVAKGKKAEEALRESEKEKSAVLDSMSELVIHQDLKHRILWVNKKAADSVNMKAEQLKGRYCHELWAKSVNQCTGCPLEETIKTCQPQQGEMTTPDGRVWSISGYPIRDANGNTTSVVEVVTNITEQKNVEEALRQERETLETVTQNIGAGLTIISKDYHVLWANKLLKDYGGAVEGKFCYSAYHQRTSVCPGCGVKEIFETGKDHIVHEQVVKGPDDQPIWLQITANPIRDENGNIIAALELSVYNTERKQMEQVLKQSEEKYRKQFEDALDAIFLADAETGILLDCNRAATKLVGRKKSELVGKHQRILHLPEEIEGKFSRTFKQHLKEREGQVLEAQVITKSGEIRDVAIKANVFELGNKRIIQGVFRDVTEQKKAEEALRESEGKLNSMLQSIGDPMSMMDNDLNILWANETAKKIFGDNIVGKKCYEVYHGRKKPCEPYPCLTLKAFQDGKVHEHDTQVIDKDGKITSFHCTANVALRDKEGKPTAVIEISRNITERKKTGEKLRESEEKFRNLAENLPNMIFINKKGRVVYANKRCEDIMGYKREEFYSPDFNFFTLIAPESIDLLKSIYSRHLKGDEILPYEYTLITKEGKKIEAILTTKLITYEGETAILGIITDITERKKAEEALRESEEKHRETIVNANVGIIYYGPEGEVKVLNPKMEQMTGFKRSEIPTLQDWFKKLYPNEEERCKIRDKWFKRMSEEGEVKEGHAIITTKDGKRRNFLFNGVRLESGDSIAFAGDITERNAAWESLEETMNALVMINEKLGVVGKLTRHDARNKLSVIANNVYLAKQKLAADHTTLEYLGDIESAVDQMEKIFDFARTYEMLGVEELSYMNVEKSVNEAATLFSGLASVKLVNECQGLTVIADSLLRQLFYNLIDDTSKHGEKVSQIRVYYEEGEDQLKLVYEDDGIGIPNDEKEKIFREGYGKGTGYGLYLIKKMCEAYGWTIRETGKPGKGAQFTMTIPKTNKSGKLSYIIN